MDQHRIIRRLVLKGTFGNFIVRGAGAFGALVMHMILARTLSLSDYGVIALGFSWLTIGGTIGSFGTDTVSLRFVAEGKARNDINQVSSVIIWGTKLAFISGSTVALSSIIFFIFSFPNLTYIQKVSLSIIALATPFFAVTLNCSGILRGAKKVVLGTSLEVVFRPFFIIFLVALLAFLWGSALNAAFVACIIFTSQCVPALFGIIQSRKLINRNEISAANNQSKVWISIATPIALTNIMSVLINNFDTIAVGYFLSSEASGVYRASSQLANLVAFGLVASNGIVAPLIAELFSSGKMQELRSMLRFSSGMISIVSLIGVLGLSFGGKLFLSAFGEEYQEGFPTLIILLIGQLINALCGPTGFVMSMTGHQKQAMKIFAVGAIFNIAMNFILIPRIGSMGAAIANVFGIAFWNLIILYYLNSKIGLDPSILSFFRRLK